MQKVMYKNFSLENGDNLKPVLAVLIVLYHSIFFSLRDAHLELSNTLFCSLDFLKELLDGFHVQTFVAISGYLFFYLKYEKDKYKTVSDIKKRAVRLLFPYIILSVVWAIPFYLIYDNGSILGVLKFFVLGIAPYQLWFLLMLFGIFVIFFFFSDFFVKHKVLSMTCFFAIYLFASIGDDIVPNVFQIWKIARYLLFFMLGILLRTCKDNKKIIKVLNHPMICGCVYFALMFIYYYLGNNVGLIAKILSMIILPLSSIIGVLMAFSIATRVRFPNKNWFISLKRYNFTIYLLHQQLIGICIFYFKDYIHTPLLILIVFVLSLTFSWVISWIICKINAIGKIFGVF